MSRSGAASKRVKAKPRLLPFSLMAYLGVTTITQFNRLALGKRGVSVLGRWLQRFWQGAHKGEALFGQGKQAVQAFGLWVQIAEPLQSFDVQLHGTNVAKPYSVPDFC